MYKVLIEKGVQKQLEKIPEPDYSKVKAAILGLSPIPGRLAARSSRAGMVTASDRVIIASFMIFKMMCWLLGY